MRYAEYAPSPRLATLVETNPSSIESVVFVPKSHEIQADLTNGKQVKVNYAPD